MTAQSLRCTARVTLVMDAEERDIQETRGGARGAPSLLRRRSPPAVVIARYYSWRSPRIVSDRGVATTIAADRRSVVPTLATTTVERRQRHSRRGPRHRPGALPRDAIAVVLPPRERRTRADIAQRHDGTDLDARVAALPEGHVRAGDGRRDPVGGAVHRGAGVRGHDVRLRLRRRPRGRGPPLGRRRGGRRGGRRRRRVDDAGRRRRIRRGGTD